MTRWLLLSLSLVSLAPQVTGQKKMFCYYSSDAQYRQNGYRFLPEDIDPTLCTHIIFAFAKVTMENGLEPTNWNDLDQPFSKGLYSRTMALKNQNPGLKVMLAVGGWVVGSEPFVPIIASEWSMRQWVDKMVAYLRLHNMDGLDMDWEFPGVRGSGDGDKEKFTDFMALIQQKFAEESRQSGKEKMILTLATAAGMYFISQAYETKEIWKHVDYMLLMAYNYHGLWEDNVGHHSGIYPNKDDVGEGRNLCQEWSVDFWKKCGVPDEKLILGIGTYGMSYTLMYPWNTKIGANASAGGRPGKYTNQEGILAYFEICEHLQQGGWTSVWIEEQMAPYAYGGDQWVGYDNVRSIGYKADYINKRNLGGAFVWSVEMDDFNGEGCGNEPYPLLRTVNKIIRPGGGVPPQRPPHTTPAPWKPPTTQAPWRPPTTQAPWRPPTTQAPWRPPTTQAPWRPPTTQAPWRPPTQAPWRPATTPAPWVRPPTQAPWRPPTRPRPVAGQPSDSQTHCRQPGVNVDPADRGHFYLCHSEGIGFRMSCGIWRVFDPVSGTCV